MEGYNMIEALRKKYEADIAHAKANIEVYLQNAVGVGEHPDIIEARIDFQRRNRMEIHKNYLSQLYVALAKNMAEIAPGDLNISFFPSSGSEAVEGCLKMAFKKANPNDKKQNRNILLHSDQSFHGKLFGAGGATASPELNYKFPSPFNTISFLH